MTSGQTALGLIREKSENATARLLAALEAQKDLNRLCEEFARQERQERRQTRGR